MKNITLTLLAILMTSALFAQKYEIKVNEGNESFNDGSHNALSVNIYESDQKEIEKAWKKLMKDYKGKVSSKKEIFADDAMIKDMTSNTCDIYAYTKTGKDGDILLIVCVDLGGAFLSSSQHSNMYSVFKKILYNFGVEMTKEAIRGHQKEAEKTLKELEKEKEDLVKQNEKLHNDIEEYKKKIEQAEKDIEQNLKDQEAKTKEIETQQKTVEEIAEKEKAVK